MSASPTPQPLGSPNCPDVPPPAKRGRSPGILLLLLLVIAGIGIGLHLTQAKPRPGQPETPAHETPFPLNLPSLLDEARTLPPADPYTPPEVRDAALAVFVDRHAPERRVTPDQTTRFPRIMYEEDTQAVVAVLRDIHDGDTARHEAAALLARSGYPGLEEELTGILTNPHESGVFRSWAVQHLYGLAEERPEAEQDSVRDLMHRGLEDRDVEVRRESLLSLVRLGDGVGMAAAAAWLRDDAETDVHDIAIRCIRMQDRRDLAEWVRARAADGDIPTRIAALVTLSHWGDAGSRGLMAAAAGDAGSDAMSGRLRRAGEAALARLDASTVIAPDDETN